MPDDWGTDGSSGASGSSTPRSRECAPADLGDDATLDGHPLRANALNAFEST
jgi:hypothetical protein